MVQEKVCLASDNFSPVHPLIFEGLSEANKGYSPAYGSDEWTSQAQNLIQEAMGQKCQVFIVPSGTGANVLGLKIACRRHESVICTDIAHLQYQESGAAESIIGCKLLTVPHQDGKVTPELILKKLKSERAFGKHSTSPRILSITQPTEVGTVYTLAELEALSTLCKNEKLFFHMDGSRIYNALASLGISFQQLLQSSPLDIMSLGGTKNGLMGAEALLIFNPSLAEGSDHLHKQTLQLVSKMRYLSAQYVPFFKNELWRSLANHANQKAKAIADFLQTIPQLALSYPVETNQIFFTAPSSWLASIQEKIQCLTWDQEKNEIRFIASWSTSEKDVEDVQSLFLKLSKA